MVALSAQKKCSNAVPFQWEKGFNAVPSHQNVSMLYPFFLMMSLNLKSNNNETKQTAMVQNKWYYIWLFLPEPNTKRDMEVPIFFSN
jgi:hypothetical protein